jgi:hypothetical protein
MTAMSIFESDATWISRLCCTRGYFSLAYRWMKFNKFSLSPIFICVEIKKKLKLRRINDGKDEFCNIANNTAC